MLGVVLIGLFLLRTCDKAPKYEKPSVATPPAYKEIAPDTFKETNDWKFAHPNDGVIRGKWWEMFNDSQLNSREYVRLKRFPPGLFETMVDWTTTQLRRRGRRENR